MHRPIVIAGNRAEFEDWCRTYRTNPNAAIFVDSPEDLEELLVGNTDVRLWGGYALNPAYGRLLAWRSKHRA